MTNTLSLNSDTTNGVKGEEEKNTRTDYNLYFGDCD